MSPGSRRAWVMDWRARLKRNRRNRCLACRGVAVLEWAHRKETGLWGPGRGLTDRLKDVRDHPRHYALLSRDCHLLYDAGFLLPPSRGCGWRCRIPETAEDSSALMARLRDARNPHRAQYIY